MSSPAQKAATQLRALLERAGDHLGRGHQVRADRQRWLTVTIEGTSEDIAPGGQLPAPLAAFGDAVEVRMQPAPGQRGTELAARFVATDGQDGAAGQEDSRADLRQALRQVKQLVEVGELLRADPRPEGYRPWTLSGLLVDRAEQKSDKGGVL